MNPPVAIVLVATVDVALKFPKVGVLVAVTNPFASVLSIELTLVPLRVRDGVVTVESDAVLAFGASVEDCYLHQAILP